jgi:hypothetical protein
MTLRLISAILDSINVIASVGEELGMVDVHVMEFGDVECIVCLEDIGVNNAVRSDSFFNNREQGFGSCVRNDGCKNLSAPLK